MVDTDSYDNYRAGYHSHASLTSSQFTDPSARSREDFSHRLSGTRYIDDSSTDETVIPFNSNRLSQNFISSTSQEQFDLDSSPRYNPNRRSTDTDQYAGTLYEETVTADIETYPLSANNMPTSRSHRFEPVEPAEDNHKEDQRLVMSSSGKSRNSADYRVGSCYHCLISIPVASLLAWILCFVCTIGWSIATWLSFSEGRDFLKYIKQEDLAYEEMALIAVALATVVMAVIFLVIATYSSSKMSRYAFTTPKKANFGYCLTVVMILMSFFGVLFWTAIVGVTMIPIAGLSIIHIMINYGYTDCLHLPSFGLKSLDTAMNGNTTTMADEVTSYQRVSNMTTPGTTNDLLCGGDLEQWWLGEWETMIPFFVSIGFAVLLEISMMAFMIAASNNARHLKEQMKYISGPYSYSTENVNGNAKPIGKDPSPNNNDTPI